MRFEEANFYFGEMAAVQGLVMGVNTILNTFMERRERRQVEKLKETFGRVKKDSVGAPSCNAENHSRQCFGDHDTDCVICYEEFASEKTSRLICGHTFHTTCIREWFKYQINCPLCRTYI